MISTFRTPPPPRCGWCGDDPLYCRYHDEEWGVPQRDGRVLFEKLCLEGLQAGLSWITILRRRDDLRIAFDGFEPDRLAAWTDEDRLAVLDRPGVIRHRGKIEAICGNARAVIDEFEGLDDFSRFVWSFAPASDAERRRPETSNDLATETAESRRLASAHAIRLGGGGARGLPTLYELGAVLLHVVLHLEGAESGEREVDAGEAVEAKIQ